MKTFLFISFFLAFSNLQSQMCPCEFGGRSAEKPLRFEIGINTFNYNEPIMYFGEEWPVFIKNASHGVLAKYHFDRYSLRAGFDYSEYNYKYLSGDPDYYYSLNSGKSFGKHFRVGIEKALVKRRVQVYVSGDLIFATEQFNGISEGRGDFIWWGYKDAYRLKMNSFGISPSLGLKYRPLRHFSISLETSVSLLYYQSRPQGNGYKINYGSSTDILFSPVRLLSFNYHFN
jgi:hypothetical protein